MRYADIFSFSDALVRASCIFESWDWEETESRESLCKGQGKSCRRCRGPRKISALMMEIKRKKSLIHVARIWVQALGTSSALDYTTKAIIVLGQRVRIIVS